MNRRMQKHTLDPARKLYRDRNEPRRGRKVLQAYNDEVSKQIVDEIFREYMPSERLEEKYHDHPEKESWKNPRLQSVAPPCQP